MELDNSSPAYGMNVQSECYSFTIFQLVFSMLIKDILLMISWNFAENSKECALKQVCPQKHAHPCILFPSKLPIHAVLQLYLTYWCRLVLAVVWASSHLFFATSFRFCWSNCREWRFELLLSAEGMLLSVYSLAMLLWGHLYSLLGSFWHLLFERSLLIDLYYGIGRPLHLHFKPPLHWVCGAIIKLYDIEFRLEVGSRLPQMPSFDHES